MPSSALHTTWFDLVILGVLAGAALLWSDRLIRQRCPSARLPRLAHVAVAALIALAVLGTATLEPSRGGQLAAAGGATKVLILIGVAFLIGLLLTSVTFITLLRAEIADRTAAQEQLQKAKDAAEAASRAKGDFLAVMSHEIRTPLTAVTGYASMLEDTALDPVQQRYVRIMRGGANSLVELLNNILDLSRLDDGKLELEEAPCSPADIIREVIELLSANAREKQLAVSFDDRLGGPLLIVVDPARFRQILMNLVGNAVKFTSTGGVTVTADWTPTDGATASGLLRIDVADTGPGIAADKLPNLFQMFTQAEPGTVRRFGGSGLGLTISRRLVEMMHGKVSVNTTVGRGSVFTFTIPTRKAALPAPLATPNPVAVDEPSASAASPAAVSSATPPTPSSGRFLVVDDNAVNRDILIGLLSRTGRTIDVADSGMAAVALAAQTRYAAILMDVAMPEMDGLTATRRIRAAESGYRTPIIAVTAATAKSDREACDAAGMDDFIAKPIDRRILLQVLERLAPVARAES